jgi:GAF domain-containing protein
MKRSVKARADLVREPSGREEIAAVLNGPADRAEKARQIAEIIRSARGYRWVGLYEMEGAEIRALGWTGAEPPAFPRFPATQGLCGAAVRSKAPVVVSDVRKDPRYLTTFGSTRSEIVVPVCGTRGTVVGLIDAESDREEAFTSEDARFLEDSAAAMAPLFEAAELPRPKPVG